MLEHGFDLNLELREAFRPSTASRHSDDWSVPMKGSNGLEMVLDFYRHGPSREKFDLRLENSSQVSQLPLLRPERGTAVGDCLMLSEEEKALFKKVYGQTPPIGGSFSSSIYSAQLVNSNFSAAPTVWPYSDSVHMAYDAPVDDGQRVSFNETAPHTDQGKLEMFYPPVPLTRTLEGPVKDDFETQMLEGVVALLSQLAEENGRAPAAWSEVMQAVRARVAAREASWREEK